MNLNLNIVTEWTDFKGLLPGGDISVSTLQGDYTVQSTHDVIVDHHYYYDAAKRLGKISFLNQSN